MRSVTSPFGLIPGKVRSTFSVLVAVVTLAGATQAADFVDVGGRVSGIQVANFDGAGLPDLGVRLDSAVVLLAANGRGVYRELLRHPTGLGGFAVGDLDGDGDSDMAVLDYGAREVVVIRAAPDDFSFELVDTDSLIPGSAAIADVDGDAMGDLIVVGYHASEFTGLVQVHLGRRDGTIRSSELRTNRSAVDVEIADVDADGMPDLIVTTSWASTGLFVFRGRGDGTFEPGVESAGESVIYPHQIALGDMNGDHFIDLAIVAGLFNPFGHPNAAQIRFGNGSTRFDSWYSYQNLVFDPYAVAVGDLDGDSFADVVYTDGSGIVIYRGSAGSLSPPQRIPTGPSGDVVIADLDLDGALDLAFAYRTGVQILWNTELRPTSVTPSTWTDVRQLFR